VLLGVALTAGDAFARRGHGHGHGHGHWRGSVGFYFGGPWGWPGYYGGYYPRPYYYAPYYYPAYTAYSRPPVYVEQAQVEAPPAQAQQLQPGYWYFCRESNAYYPYVQQCAGAWERVAPQPPSQ
jgi:hypothetical protein